MKLAGGMRIVPDHVLKDAPPADIVILPGGAHVPLLADSKTMAGLDQLLREAQIRWRRSWAVVAWLLGLDAALQVAEHLAYDWQTIETSPRDAHGALAPGSSK